MSIPELSPDFARVRVTSVKHNLSVTADITLGAFDLVDANNAAGGSSCDLFTVTYVGFRDGLPTFTVLMKGAPKDPELVLRTIVSRLERGYDHAVGEQLVR